MKLNEWTFLISIFFLPIWLVWELVVLWLHSRGALGGPIAGAVSDRVGTISMVMKYRGYQLNALPFFWSSMMAHWWWNWFGTKTWEVAYPAVLFWLMVLATLTADIVLWNTPYESLHAVVKFYRAPMVQCAVGFLAAYFLFPQQMDNNPGYRWW